MNHQIFFMKGPLHCLQMGLTSLLIQTSRWMLQISLLPISLFPFGLNSKITAEVLFGRGQRDTAGLLGAGEMYLLSSQKHRGCWIR